MLFGAVYAVAIRYWCFAELAASVSRCTLMKKNFIERGGSLFL